MTYDSELFLKESQFAFFIYKIKKIFQLLSSLFRKLYKQYAQTSNLIIPDGFNQSSRMAMVKHASS